MGIKACNGHNDLKTTKTNVLQLRKLNSSLRSIVHVPEIIRAYLLFVDIMLKNNLFTKIEFLNKLYSWLS